MNMGKKHLTHTTDSAKEDDEQTTTRKYTYVLWSVVVVIGCVVGSRPAFCLMVVVSVMTDSVSSGAKRSQYCRTLNKYH